MDDDTTAQTAEQFTPSTLVTTAVSAFSKLLAQHTRHVDVVHTRGGATVSAQVGNPHAPVHVWCSCSADGVTAVQVGAQVRDWAAGAHEARAAAVHYLARMLGLIARSVPA
jgi:hypothetical protein